MDNTLYNNLPSRKVSFKEPNKKLSNIDGYEKILFYNNEYYDVVKDEYKLVKFYGNNYYLVKINDYEERLVNNKWYIFNKLNKLERKRTQLIF